MISIESIARLASTILSIFIANIGSWFSLGISRKNA